MFPIISALLAFVVGLFRSRTLLCLENLALRQALSHNVVWRPCEESCPSP
jgi:hypothetical protein